MNQTIFSTFLDFLYNGKEPWKSTFSNAQYKTKTSEISSPPYNVQPIYELTFPDPLTDKVKYYKKLIDLYAVQELNNFHSIVSESNDKARLYQVYLSLSRTLPGLMDDLHSILEALDLINPKFEPNSNGRINLTDEYDNSYILHYLKHELMRLYLEVIESYPDFRKDAEKDINNLYIKFFGHIQPTKPFITEAPALPIGNLIKKQNDPTKANEFVPLKYDFRAPKDSILTYDYIIKNSIEFTRFEEKLFENEFIDNEYNFIESHGLKNKLAAIYHRIIEKCYFHERKYKPPSIIRPIDIRAFLDYRYNTNLSQQFRRYRQNEEKWRKYLDGLFWLGQLPQLKKSIY